MSDHLPEVLLDLHKWDQLSRAECEEVALQVERQLPPSFRFTSLETYASTSEQHHVAYFGWTVPPGPSLTHQEPPYSYKQYATTFALIPGGTVTLGYDREHPVLPSDELIYDAEEECLIPDINGVKHTFSSGLFQDAEEHEPLQYLYPSISFKKREIDTEDREKLPPNYRAITEYMEKLLLPPKTITLRPFLLEQSYFHIGNFMNLLGVYSKDMHHFQYGGNFPVTHRLTHRLVTGLLGKQGFRLPTSDEWEYACQAGRKKLFFWEESSKLPEYYPEFPQNTFGLQIANYCYDWEFCMEPGILRGGDGGCTQCGWAGYFAHYLTYTSAYYQTYEPTSAVGACFRRAYSL